jgi:hypothetical protein
MKEYSTCNYRIENRYWYLRISKLSTICVSNADILNTELSVLWSLHSTSHTTDLTGEYIVLEFKKNNRHHKQRRKAKETIHRKQKDEINEIKRSHFKYVL